MSDAIRDAINTAVSVHISDLYNTLLVKLPHGDADHRRWLTEAVTAIFQGTEPPAPYGKANWEAERAALLAERDRLIAQRDENAETAHKIIAVCNENAKDRDRYKYALDLILGAKPSVENHDYAWAREVARTALSEKEAGL